MFRILKVPVYVPVIVPKKMKRSTNSEPAGFTAQPPEKKKPVQEALYETIDEFNDIWSDLKRK